MRDALVWHAVVQKNWPAVEMNRISATHLALITRTGEGGKAVHMGEGGQVIGYSKPGGMRNAGRRNGARCPP